MKDSGSLSLDGRASMMVSKASFSSARSALEKSFHLWISSSKAMRYEGTIFPMSLRPPAQGFQVFHRQSPGACPYDEELLRTRCRNDSARERRGLVGSDGNEQIDIGI